MALRLVRNPEEGDRQAEIADLKKRIADIDRLIDKNLVTGGAKDKLIPARVGYLARLAELGVTYEKDTGQDAEQTA
jgi:hypothetical protein